MTSASEPGSWSLTCRSCGALYGFEALFRCPACHGVLIANAPDPDPETMRRMLNEAGENLWHYRSVLPVMGNGVSLGEGETPLLRCFTLRDELEVAELFIKNETVNPTLSFKDRATSLGVTLARRFGAPGVVAASTGNTAVSAAAYAARAGFPCRLFCARDAVESEKIMMARKFGAEVHPVEGDFSSAHAAVAHDEDSGWFTLTTTYRNPYLAEAHRTVAFELFRQTEGRLPDWILVPVGAGPLLYGIFRGFVLLRDVGIVDRVPRLVAVQADACRPIVDAWNRGSDVVAAGVSRCTVAGAIADPLRGYEDEGAVTLDALRDSNGVAVSVSEDEIVTGTREFATQEGVILEPAAASTLPALRRLLANGTIPRESRVVVLATGHGAKEV